MTILAFYKARGTIADRMIRLITRSDYSHVEILPGCMVPPQPSFEWDSFSSSGRDGGVRLKRIRFDEGSWDFVAVPWADDDRIQNAMISEVGLGYDWIGLFLSQLLNLRRGSSRRWFCSEMVAHVLEMPTPYALSPGDLAAWAKFLATRC
jgi:hypothetical protein